MRRPLRAQLFALLVVTGLALAACAPTGVPPVTSTAPGAGPPAVVAQHTLTAANGPMGQTDGPVWSLAVSGNTVFAGGEFTHVRAVNTAPGDPSEVAETDLAAFNKNTGVQDATFTHSADGRVSAMAVSGSTLYVGGLFTHIDGVARSHVAAFNLAVPGYPMLPWAPDVLGTGLGVRAIAVSGGNVFLGGDFTGVGSLTSQANIAAVDAVTAAPVTAWQPVVDGPIDALLVAPGASSNPPQYLIGGGNFNNVNSHPDRALTSLKLSDGTSGPLDALIQPCGSGCTVNRSDIKTLATDGTSVFAGAEGTGAGVFDGTLAFNPQTGHQIWKDNCLGATQAIAVVGSNLYVGSHAHDCSAIGGFGPLPITTGPGSGAAGGPPTWHHLMGEQLSTGKLVDWFPTTDEGTTPDALGPRAMATDGTNLFLGGEFTKVNGVGQQGITRFMAGAARAFPTAVSNAAAQLLPGGRAVISFTGASDPDSNALTYQLYRDGGSTPVQTLPAQWAHWWDGGHFTFHDSGLSAGPHSYTIAAVDETSNRTQSTSVTASTVGGGYRNTVIRSGATTYWRLDETSGTLALDSTTHANSGTYSGPLNRGIAGAVPSGKAIHLGPTAHVFSNVVASVAPARFSVGVWIRTTTTVGGRILGFGNSQSGTSTEYDRTLYMLNDGQLIFGTHKGVINFLWSPKSYNDGTWHFVVIELDPAAGMRLYVDGVLVAFNSARTSADSYMGWWRIGSDNLAAWPERPTSNGISADIDEFAIYSGLLSPAAIRNQMTSE